MDENKPTLMHFVNMEDPFSVLEEVKKTVSLIFPDFDYGTIDLVFNDLLNLFAGNYPGYRKCNTRYHDLKHTTDTFMALARLIHGATNTGADFTRRGTSLALISALMHDTGYIQTDDDKTGTGAKYTLNHVDLSVDFMSDYFDKKGFSRENFSFCRNIVRCTGLEVDLAGIQFSDFENNLLGKMLGTADLQGQMADRNYLEKLIHLYHEFREGGVSGYESELDLLRKTPDFYQMTLTRFDEELDGVWRYMRHHFISRWGLDKDVYKTNIERHMAYIKQILRHHSDDYRRYLRRGCSL
ncbi:MAG: hypothetical protein LJE96_21760 [Deltaproteobacteria bacterium]|nr:hypothetical protein [Deltaproteobacteria bacterium]